MYTSTPPHRPTHTRRRTHGERRREDDSIQRGERAHGRLEEEPQFLQRQAPLPREVFQLRDQQRVLTQQQAACSGKRVGHEPSLIPGPHLSVPAAPDVVTAQRQHAVNEESEGLVDSVAVGEVELDAAHASIDALERGGRCPTSAGPSAAGDAAVITGCTAASASTVTVALHKDVRALHPEQRVQEVLHQHAFLQLDRHVGDAVVLQRVQHAHAMHTGSHMTSVGRQGGHRSKNDVPYRWAMLRHTRRRGIRGGEDAQEDSVRTGRHHKASTITHRQLFGKLCANQEGPRTIPFLCKWTGRNNPVVRDRYPPHQASPAHSDARVRMEHAPSRSTSPRSPAVTTRMLQMARLGRHELCRG